MLFACRWRVVVVEKMIWFAEFIKIRMEGSRLRKMGRTDLLMDLWLRIGLVVPSIQIALQT